MPNGRPSSFKQSVADKICERIALGESLRSICEDESTPSRVTVLRWLRSDAEWGEAFRAQYARAREDQADSLFDEINEIADDGANDWMEKLNKDGELIGWTVNGEAVQRSRLRIDARRWQAAKLRPKKYGEKLDVTSGGDKIPSGFQVIFGRDD